jgi:hypothetical protein
MLRSSCLHILIAVLVSGCLTTRNNKAISEARSSIQEFDRTLDGKGSHRILTGRLKFSDGKALMQFDKVLLGEGALPRCRILTLGYPLWGVGKEMGEQSKGVPYPAECLLYERYSLSHDPVFETR